MIVEYRLDRLARLAKADPDKRFDRLVKSIDTELVPCAVGGSSLDAILPALDRSIDDRRGLAVA